jgi:hypothetical protein
MPKLLRFSDVPPGLPIREEDAVELRALYEELPCAALRVAEALRTAGTGLRGDELLPFWRADNAVREIIGRIDELLAPERWEIPTAPEVK